MIKLRARHQPQSQQPDKDCFAWSLVIFYVGGMRKPIDGGGNIVTLEERGARFRSTRTHILYRLTVNMSEGIWRTIYNGVRVI